MKHLDFRKTGILWIGFVAFHTTVAHAAQYLPEFEAFSQKFKNIKIKSNSSSRKQGLKSLTVNQGGSAEDFLSSFEDVRVLIFPHVGRYVTPHGRDTKLKEITFKASTGKCRAFKGPQSLPLSREGVRIFDQTPLQEGAVLSFKYDQVIEPLWVECDSTATLVREAGTRRTTYEGAFYLKRGVSLQQGPMLNVINVLPFESYLKGVVPAEMPASWHEEALKAQAVAARSYAAYQVQLARKTLPTQDYDVDDTVMYQAFLGASGRVSTTDLAVDSTRSEVMKYQGRIVKSYFHADSGGNTEDAKNVWPEDIEDAVYCVGKPEAYDLNWINSDWVVSRTLADVTQRLTDKGILEPGEVIMEVALGKEKYPSGRAIQVQIVLSNREVRWIPTVDFQFAMGFRSAWFEIGDSKLSSALKFRGLGFGHGAGMNQWGAKVLAQRMSWNYRKILDFYYTGVEY